MNIAVAEVDILNQELDALNTEVQEADADRIEAAGTPHEAACEKIWQQLVDEKSLLTYHRQCLQDRLASAGVRFLSLLK